MNKRWPILIGMLLLLFALWLQITTHPTVKTFLTRLDNMAYDVQLRTKIFTHHEKPAGNVAVVDIDDRSLKIEGRWPWSRKKMALLLNNLAAEGVVVIALDVMFSEKENNIADDLLDDLTKKKLLTPPINAAINQVKPEFDYDAKLAESLANKDIVLGMTFVPYKEISGVLPQPIMALTTPVEKALDFIEWPGFISDVAILQNAAKMGGFINVIPDQDGIIRRVSLLMRYQDKLYPSLAFAAIKLFLLSDIKLISNIYGDKPQLEAIQIADHIIPTDAQAQMLVPFRGKSYTFPYYSATDILHNTLPPNTLAGKIIFLGTSATGLGDLRGTAIEGVYPGVEVQATIADGILSNNFYSKPEWTHGTEIFITLILGFVLAILFPFLGPRLLTILIIVIPTALVFINNGFWIKTGLIISVLIPISLTILLAIANMVYGYLFETRRRERLKEMFGQYVPEKHIDSMLKASGGFALTGEDREMTVLFADIRNFTTISEPMTATELKEMLNQFFTPMTEIIFKYRGTIDKYIGDLIMAFWGAPLKDNKHAEHAISAALDMQVAVKKLKPVFAAQGWAEVTIGIGLNSGVMSVGDMGSQFRRNYTVLGDAVNLGSRVEGLTKFYGVKIMVTEATQKNQTKFLFRQIDRVRVKGKKLGVTIFEVICKKTEATRERIIEVQQSDQALNYYFNRQWDAAIALLNTLHAAHPETKVYKIYLKRIAEFKQNPPAEDWDGVYEHVNK